MYELIFKLFKRLLERKKMGINLTIENMEKHLKKKKEERRIQNEAKAKKLIERILAKNHKIKALTDEVLELNKEVDTLTADLEVAGVETKTEPFVPGGDDAKDPGKKQTSKK